MIHIKRSPNADTRSARETESKLIYRGRPVEELTQEELIEALEVAYHTQQQSHETVAKMGELLRGKHD